MTTQPEEAVGNEATAPELTPEERLSAAFGDPVEGHQEEEPAEDGEPIDEAEDETEAEAEADDLPPIEAPVSWDAEAKERFAKLPREDQEYLAKRESERERFVQQKSLDAARARQDVEQAAHQQLAQIENGYAQQFQQLAAQIQPQRPDPAMLQYDPQSFYAEQAKYEAQVAQQQQLQRQAQEYAQQAQQREVLAQQQEAQREHQLIVEQFPEYLDPTNGPRLRQELSGIARELGYPTDLIEQARAPDILAMRKAAEWKAKADKLDKLNAKQMEKVRAAKGLPKVSTPGTQKAPGAVRQAQYATDREAMKRGDRDATTRVLDSFFVKPS